MSGETRRFLRGLAWSVIRSNGCGSTSAAVRRAASNFFRLARLARASRYSSVIGGIIFDTAADGKEAGVRDPWLAFAEGLPSPLHPLTRQFAYFAARDDALWR